MTFPHLLSDDVLSVLIGTKPYQTTRSNPAWTEIISALSDPDVTDDEMVALLSPIGYIDRALPTNGYVQVRNGQLYYGDEVVHTTLGLKIIDLLREGFDIEPWLLFAENVYANPFRESREELYTFLEKAQLPITEDGCFIAYKKVNAGYKDCHTNTFDNSVGQVLEMARELVDNNRNNHCSYGFHFCSESYLRSFHGSHVMLVKINPKDVVSIPTDYDFAKGRTCRYEVIGEIEETRIASHIFDPVYVDFEVTLVDDAEVPEDLETETTTQKGKNKLATQATKKNKKAIAIDTERLGRLTMKQFKQGVKDHDNSMAAWARALGVPSSTVRNWYADLRAAKARRDALAELG